MLTANVCAAVASYFKKQVGHERLKKREKNE